MLGFSGLVEALLASQGGLYAKEVNNKGHDYIIFSAITILRVT